MTFSLPRKSKEIKVKTIFLRWWVSVNFLFTNPRDSVELIHVCLQKKIHDPKIVTDVYSWLKHRSSDATNRLSFCFGLLLFGFANLFLKHHTSAPELESHSAFGATLLTRIPPPLFLARTSSEQYLYFFSDPVVFRVIIRSKTTGDWLPTWQLRFDFIVKGYQICS